MSMIQTDLQVTIVAVSSITLFFATSLLALRLYTSVFIERKWFLDDILVFLAWSAALAFFIGMILQMPNGYGMHIDDVSPAQLSRYYDLLLMLGLTYLWPPTFTKMAMLVFYYRINPSRKFRLCLYIVAFALFVYTLVLTIFFAWPCNPMKYGSGTCVNNLTMAHAVFNIVTDVVIIAIPIPMIHRLVMPLKQKLVVGFALFLGSAATVASIGRMSYVKAMANNPDFTWTQASTSLWSTVELNLGVLCNLMLRLMPFVKAHLPWLARFMGERPSRVTTSRRLRGEASSRTYAFELQSTDRDQEAAQHDKDLLDKDAARSRVIPVASV